MKICSENTAITNGIATSVKKYEKLIGKDAEVLDYGAGKLRNSIYLKNKAKIHIVETPTQIKRLTDKNGQEIFEGFYGVYDTENLPEQEFDIILCTFVLCVIADEQQRDELLKYINTHLKQDGYLIFETRGLKDILGAKTKEPYGKGFLMGSGNIKTFQRGYSEEELDQLFKEFNFKIVEKSISNKSLIYLLSK